MSTRIATASDLDDLVPLFAAYLDFYGVGAGPEGIGRHAATGNGFVIDEIEQHLGDLQATDSNTLSHLSPLCFA